MDLFEVEIIHQIITSLNNDDELGEVERLSYGDNGNYIDIGYWDLEADPIAKIEPRCLLIKGKKGKITEKQISEVVFQSGNLSYANYKPTELKKMLDSYLNKG